MLPCALAPLIALALASTPTEGGTVRAALPVPLRPPPGRLRSVALERAPYVVGDPPPTAVVFAATDAGLFRDSEGAGDFVRLDLPAGTDVTAIALSQRERAVEQPIVAHRTRVAYDTTLYAGSGSQVLRSGDGGTSWTSAALPSAASPVQSLLAGPRGRVWAVAGEDLFRSADGGASWGKIGGTLPRPVRAVALDREDAGVLYAAAGRGVFRSTDGGGRWIGLGTGALEAALGRASDAEADVAVTAVAVSGRRILATARLRLPSRAHLPLTVVSPDAGKSWTRLTRAVDAPLVWDSADSESGRVFAVVAGKALSTADDGASWVSVGDEERPIAAVLAVESDWPGRIWGTAADGTLTRVDARCASGPAALCLRGGRFRIEVEWEKPVGGGDALRAEPTSDDSGEFSLGRASNVLLTVQIRDARAANGHFWVDVDARTIRGFSLLVTDLGRGATMRYSHPEGQRTKFSDHEAF